MWAHSVCYICYYQVQKFFVKVTILRDIVKVFVYKSARTAAVGIGAVVENGLEGEDSVDVVEIWDEFLLH